ncbi:MAG: endonuclease/exonuclease/phosphatase family protein, partial [Shewanella sp.]
AAEMAIAPAKQQQLVEGYLDKSLTEAEMAVAAKVIQIRNVAAIIQTQRPAVLMAAEFNNDGSGKDMKALNGFRINYLAVPQSSLGAGGKADLLPINDPVTGNYATNTGLASGLDLDNDGTTTSPGDGWGFGFYHGQYAFGLLSQYPIEHDKVRTFQEFKWKDMTGAKNIAVNCKPDNTATWCADDFWYSKEEWEQIPLSSKNHVDAPVTIKTASGDKTIHLLMSHPTPPVFDKGVEAPYNVVKNADEVRFWVDYVAGGEQGAYIYDDKGLVGGLANGESFVVLGDLNADPENGDGDLTAIRALLNHAKVNHYASTGIYAPKSFGGPECLSSGECRKDIASSPYPEMITSTFGLRVDHVTPSVDLNVTDSGIFWPISSDDNYKLVNDERIGKYGKGKDVSSDHRLVWIDIEL